MGLRATVIKKYEIEYGNTHGFNYESGTLADIIYEFCADYYVGDDDFGGYNTDEIWEVGKEDFKYMLSEIRKMTDEEFEEVFSDRVGREEVIRVFEGFLNETPEDSNYVRIGWL